MCRPHIIVTVTSAVADLLISIVGSGVCIDVVFEVVVDIVGWLWCSTVSMPKVLEPTADELAAAAGR